MDADKLKELQETRLNALIEKWGNAGKLTPAEREEIAPHVPQVAAELKAEKAEAKKARVEEAKEELSNWPYKKTAAEYAEEIPDFGVVRRIRAKVAQGREAISPEYPDGDLPPLDEPWLLADWWARNMKHTVPNGLLALAKQTPAETAADAEAEHSPIEDLGDYASALAGIRWESGAALRALKLADSAEPRSPSAVKWAQERFKTAQAVRKDWEASATRILKEQGAAVDRVEAERLLHQAHGAIMGALRSSATGLYQDLMAASLPALEMDLEEVATLIDEVGEGSTVSIPLPPPIELERFSSLINAMVDNVCHQLIGDTFSLLPEDFEEINGFESQLPGGTIPAEAEVEG